MKQKVEFVKQEGRNITLKWLGFCPQLEKEKEYSLEIKPYKDSRSLEQNRLMWSIINEISKKTGNSEMDVYVAGLVKVGAKSDYIMAVPEAEEELLKVFRAVKAVEYRKYNNKKMVVFKVWYGSSKFDTNEMTKLIDYFQGLYFDLES